MGIWKESKGVMTLEKNRIVVCPECGCLYDITYVGKVETRKGSVVKFECQNCGMVPVVYKTL